jgi:manganese/zinc/iron transport system permease protein
MIWTSMDLWIVAAGVLSAVACALPGNFLVLRRMSMMGDAISHAVLPGLAVAFLVTGSRSGLPMFVGAAAVGLLTALLTQWIHRLGKVEESASMGVVFTTLFALGLIVIVRAADRVDLDPGCVLYGAIELTPLDTISLAGAAIPRVVITLGCVVLVNALFVILFFKELKLTAFDPELATTLGLSARVMHYALMAVVAVTTVACFESVGSILVIAMLVVPPATAYLLTDRLGRMIALSVAIAAISAIAGHAAAVMGPAWFGFNDISTSTSGMMAVVVGLLFLAALLASPRHGVFARIWRRHQLDLRRVQEDLLGLVYRLEERGDRAPALAPALMRDALGVGPVARLLAWGHLRRQGHLARREGAYHLTDAGRLAARNLVRSHRLWESYLNRHLGLPDAHAHAAAERLEHVTTPALQSRLAERTNQPTRDPQGRTIPPG